MTDSENRRTSARWCDISEENGRKVVRTSGRTPVRKRLGIKCFRIEAKWQTVQSVREVQLPTIKMRLQLGMDPLTWHELDSLLYYAKSLLPSLWFRNLNRASNRLTRSRLRFVRSQLSRQNSIKFFYENEASNIEPSFHLTSSFEVSEVHKPPSQVQVLASC